METSTVALVTGGAGDIGFSIARRFADRSARVILCDRLGDVLAERVEADDHRDRFEAHTVDLMDPSALRDFVAGVLARHQRIDVLVNNAAKQHDGDVRAAREDDFEESFAINLRAPFLLSKALTPAMCAAGGGSVVNVASVHGLAPGPARFAYATMKAGLIGMTRSMAVDLGPYNVRVNAVVPTAIRTSGLLKAWSEERSVGGNVTGLYEWAAKVHPMRRIGEAVEVAEVVEFLATAAFVTGETIRVDGGLLASLKLLPPAS